MRSFSSSLDREHDPDLAPAQPPEHAPAAGRSTLSEHLHAKAARPPLFAEGAAWDELGDDAADAHDKTQLAHLQAAPSEHDDEAASVTTAAPASDGAPPPALDAAALAPPPVPAHDEDEDHDDDHDNDHDEDHDHDDHGDAPLAHASAAKAKPKSHPLERTISGHAVTGYVARHDKYNRATVKNNRVSKNKHVAKNQISRPGVRVDHRDRFYLAVDQAPRYLIDNADKAVPMDTVTAKFLLKKRLALNPAHSRRLTLPDNSHITCAFVWIGGRGAGWMPIDCIKGDHAEIKRRIDDQGRRVAPAKASTKHVTRFLFIDGNAAGATARDQKALAQPGDKGKFILNKQKSGEANAVSHYLQHADVDGVPGGRDYININVNLPGLRVPPVAIDTAVPGQFFFIPRGDHFYREIAIYELGRASTRRRQTWVYGFLAKMGPKGPVPDENRRGWVPLRTVKKG